MYRLDNQWQTYDWGSVTAIPDFLGTQAPGEPVAELWLGTHEIAPSVIADSQQLLSDVVGSVPFMLKILAAEQPLSIQAHPPKDQADEGFRRESDAGLPIADPQRTFKDPYGKPEMVFALTTFETLIGFRPTAEILRLLAIVDTELAQRLGSQLDKDPGFAGIVRLVEMILNDESISDTDLDELIKRCRELSENGVDVRRAFTTVVELAKHHPTDRGVIVSLLLNRLTLQPGEAAYLEPGIIHAYMNGLCLELTGPSDNVLRAGLTNKHIDVSAMLQTLKAGMSHVSRITPMTIDEYTEVFRMPEFALAVTGSPNDRGIKLHVSGVQFLMCIAGHAKIRNSQGEEIELNRGESIYADDSDGDLTVSGTCEIAQAFVPGEDMPLRVVGVI